MNKITCKEIYEDYIFDGPHVENPLDQLSNLLVENETNEELYKILNTNIQSISIDYFVNRFDRIMSPLFLRIMDHYEGSQSQMEDVAEDIARIIKTKFFYNWNKLAEAVFSDYNPIDNYNMVENRNTDFEEHTVTDNNETVKNKYSGFNSTNMSDVSESDTTGNIETTKNDTGAKTKNELTRRGNIGVTTTAQMIEGEYKLRKKNLIDLIYKDIDSVLFINYYC